jgi:hypothetical protein
MNLFLVAAVLPLFICETELPSTSMEVRSSISAPASLELEVNHHFGADSVPVAMGVVTARDLIDLQAKATTLKKLGDHFVVPFQSKNCDYFGPELFSCFSRDETNINGLKVSGYGFTTRVVHSQIYDYDFKSHQVVFSFFYNGIGYDMPMSYSPAECRFK